MIEISHLSFRYGKKAPLVLDDVSLSLEPGQVSILLGKNGVGKSTLFKLLVGLLKIPEGTILFDREDIKKKRPKERAKIFSYVPQAIAFGDLSVLETILSGRIAHYGLFPGESDLEKVKEVASELGLLDYLSRPVNELSGGEKQKVAIARALVQEPRVLIFDEPTGNLDVGNEQAVLEIARKVAKEKGIAVFLSIHDLSVASSYGDRFFLLKGGKLLYQGGVEEVYRDEILSDVYNVPISVHDVDGQKFLSVQGDH